MTCPPSKPPTTPTQLMPCACFSLPDTLRVSAKKKGCHAAKPIKLKVCPIQSSGFQNCCSEKACGNRTLRRESVKNNMQRRLNEMFPKSEGYVVQGLDDGFCVKQTIVVTPASKKAKCDSAAPQVCNSSKLPQEPCAEPPSATATDCNGILDPSAPCPNIPKKQRKPEPRQGVVHPMREECIDKRVYRDGEAMCGSYSGHLPGDQYIFGRSSSEATRNIRKRLLQYMPYEIIDETGCCAGETCETFKQC